MTEQIFEDRMDTPNIVIEADSPPENSDAFTGNAPINAVPAYEKSSDGTIPGGASTGASERLLTPLLNRDEAAQFRMRWNVIQGKFVDEPCAAVQQADALVTDVIEQISKMFASELSSLEGQWNQGNEVSTEDLRQTIQRYRSFFNRLIG
jgi:hypothetical protein